MPCWRSRSSGGASVPLTAGFTLMEVLVVAAVIGLLAALLLPALSRVRQKTEATYCMNNSRQLALAWLMYADDHHGVLVANRYGNEVRGGANPDNWVSGWMDWGRQRQHEHGLSDRSRLRQAGLLCQSLARPV